MENDVATRAPRNLPSPIRTGLMRCLGLGIALVAMASCGGERADEPANTTAAAPASQLEIRQPRAVLTPSMGAVYFTVVNPGARNDRLLRVVTTAARVAETHETVEDGGMMRMVPRPEGFEVPAGGKLELQPGGKHIMLVEPRAPAAAGRIGLTLHFEHAGAIEVEAELPAMADGQPGGSGQP
jgi:copper(I)-binding protein